MRCIERISDEWKIYKIGGNLGTCRRAKTKFKDPARKPSVENQKNYRRTQGNLTNLYSAR